MNMIKRTVIAVAISSTFVVNANAGDLNYNYLTVNYVSNDVLGVNTTGFGLDGSFDVSDNVNVFIGYQAPSALGVTFSETKLGVGYHQPMNEKGDWYAKVDYRSVEAFGATGSGYALSGGARAALSDKFEIDAYAGYANIEGFSGLIYGIDGTYNITGNVGITAGYMSDTDAFGWSGFKLGARMYF